MGRTRERKPAETMTEFCARLDISPDRILMRPPPGMATEADLEEAWGRNRCIELIDGVLVEKAMGVPESVLGLYIGRVLGNHVEEHDLGVVCGADGPFRLASKVVRLPDVSFISWANWKDEMATLQIAPVAPDLAIEVVSPSNRAGEIDRKIRDLFIAGTRLIWVIRPKTSTADVYTAPDKRKRLGKDGVLDGGKVVPGFRLPLADLFARLKPRRKRS